jgi:hypothetical protein
MGGANRERARPQAPCTRSTGSAGVAPCLVPWLLVGHAVTAEHFQGGRCSTSARADRRPGADPEDHRRRGGPGGPSAPGRPGSGRRVPVAEFRSLMAQLSKDALQAREVARARRRGRTTSSQTGRSNSRPCRRHRGWAAASRGKHGQLREAARALNGRAHGVQPVPVSSRSSAAGTASLSSWLP